MLAGLASENWIGLPDGLPESSRYFEVSRENGRIVLTPVCLTDPETARDWAPELVKTAYSWLEQAQREFEAERDLAEGRCLWEAVRAAITAAGVTKGAPVDRDQEMFDFIVGLDREDGDNHKHLVKFGVAQSLRDQVSGPDPRGATWDSLDFDTARRAAKELVDYLAGLVTTGK